MSSCPLYGTQTCPERFDGLVTFPFGGSICSQAGFETTK